MFNMRYHVASLVAVFLALSVGLLLGTVVQERGVVDSQRDFVVTGLRKEFNEIRKENSALKVQSDFAAEAVPSLVAGMLEGKRVLVLVNEGRSDSLAPAKETVEQAGGVAAVATLRRPGFGTSDADVAKQLSALLGVAAEEDLDDVVAQTLASEWATGTPTRPVTDKLAELRQLRLEGLGPGEKADAVLVVAEWDGKPDQALFALAAEMVERGGAVGVVAGSESDSDVVAESAAFGSLGAVEDVTVPQGRLSLAMLLSDRAQGRYGQGSGGPPYPPFRSQPSP